MLVGVGQLRGKLGVLIVGLGGRFGIQASSGEQVLVPVQHIGADLEGDAVQAVLGGQGIEVGRNEVFLLHRGLVPDVVHAHDLAFKVVLAGGIGQDQRGRGIGGQGGDNLVVELAGGVHLDGDVPLVGLVELVNILTQHLLVRAGPAVPELDGDGLILFGAGGDGHRHRHQHRKSQDKGNELFHELFTSF